LNSISGQSKRWWSVDCAMHGFLRLSVLVTGLVAGDENCMSQQGFVFNPIPPRKKALTRPLSFCEHYSRRTCCTTSMTNRIVRRAAIATSAGFSPKCRRMTEMLECSVCHPDVGTGRIRSVCDRTCNAWFGACKEEFYSASGTSLRPCFGNALVCSPLGLIVTSGLEFCKIMGHVPESQTGDDAEQRRQRRRAKKRAKERKKRHGNEGGEQADTEETVSADDTAEEDQEDEDLDEDLPSSRGGAVCFDGTVPPGDGVPESEVTYDHQHTSHSYQYGSGEASLLVKAIAVLGTLLCMIIAAQILMAPNPPPPPPIPAMYDDDDDDDGPEGLDGIDLSELTNDDDPVVSQMLEQMRQSQQAAAVAAAEA